LSFNILLNHETEFEGGGTYFQRYDARVCLRRGDALLHSGQLLHAGHRITKGVRYLVVGFMVLAASAQRRLWQAAERLAPPDGPAPAPAAAEATPLPPPLSEGMLPLRLEQVLGLPTLACAAAEDQSCAVFSHSS
jgi:hypothetical protein